MPGAYAHITMVNVLKEPARLQRLGVSKPGAASVMTHFKFCELGAVSPDYPYLALGDEGAAKWADLMHYERTGELVRALVNELRGLSGMTREKAFAWLLGYSAHVATDVTIHPVVELKVGEYAENKTAHRVCEMHQDAYIFTKRMNVGEIGLSEHLTSGILRCVQKGKSGEVDHDIKRIWETALTRAHPIEASQNPPAVDTWHRGFDIMVNRIGEEGHHLIPLARHVAANCGLVYPAIDSINHKEYIAELRVPGGSRQHYDVIFERAINSVGAAWASLDKAVFGNDPKAADFFGNWNLDTGRNEAGQLVFWT